MDFKFKKKLRKKQYINNHKITMHINVISLRSISRISSLYLFRCQNNFVIVLFKK